MRAIYVDKDIPRILLTKAIALANGSKSKVTKLITQSE